MLVLALEAGAAAPRLYESGPARGAGFIRVANVSSGVVSIAPAGRARIDMGAQDAQRVTQYEAVAPGRIVASIHAGKESRKLDVPIAANELITVVIGHARNGGIAMHVFRESPTDFNALQSSIALYDADESCTEARLVAEKKTVVISGVAPGAIGRRAVNPVKVALAVVCAGLRGELPADLGQLESGERYSVLVFAAPGGSRRTLAWRDEIAVTRD